MPTKRRILEMLSLNELQGIANTYEPEVGDRRVRDQLIDAAGHSRKVSLAEVLGGYPRDRLKELCRALDLDDRGKEKAPIVDRILGNEPEQGNLKLSWADGPSAAPEKAPEVAKPPKQQPSWFGFNWASRGTARLVGEFKLLSGELRVATAVNLESAT